ncbi:MauE/DoxX family redox-associated membrane protein [Nonomuraea sp. NPDC059007]|uniref:MauE/DoxX family redox-associated membrane protein n=1 Tax=Nonomuraea sp. NPDC059007 TaxID=3346692 RepID=UPI00369ECA7E
MMIYTSIACMALLATVFGMSFLGKLRNPGPFIQTMRSLVPGPSTIVVAYSVIGAEGLVVLFFLASMPGAEWAAVTGFFLSGGLTIAFTLAMRRMRGGHCHCFGRSTALRYSTRHVVRNLLLFAAAVTGYAGHGRVGELEAHGIAAALIIGVTIGSLTVIMDDLFVMLG